MNLYLKNNAHREVLKSVILKNTLQEAVPPSIHHTD